VNTAKSVNAGVGVVGTALLFTPLFPIGLTLGLGSGLGGIFVAGGDKIADNIRKS